MTGISSSAVTVHVLDGSIQLAIAEGQAVQLDAATFYAMGELQFADGSFSAADVLALADPGIIDDPTIELDPSIDLDDITLSVVGDDLHITYTGDNSDWIDPTTLMGRRILSYLQSAGGASQQAMLSLGQGGSVLVLTNFLNAANPAQYVTQLSNGTQSIDLLAAYNMPRTQNGSAYSDSLVGGDVVDTILAGAGDDHVQAGAGDDVLTGQEGNDLLEGGTGNDAYHFRLGDGQDIVLDTSGADTIQFGEGILANALEISEINGGLEIIVRRDANGQVLDRVFIAGWINQPNNGIERLLFADGTSLDAAQISAAITGNHAPTVGAISDQSISFGENFSFGLPTSLFDDADVGDSLTIVARLSDGNALPDWLQFDSQTLSFSGVFEPTSLSPLSIIVYAIDSNGTFRSGTFNIIPAGVMVGDQQANSITGDDAANFISGLAGADTLVGAGGNDVIDGGQDNDYLSGQTGDDTLIGGGGNDTLVGGAGTNIIRIRPGDGSDVVLLSADGIQVVELAEGVLPSSISAAFSSNGDLQIRYGSDANDCITIRDAADYIAGRGNQAIDLATALQLRIGLNSVMNGLDLVALANAASADADAYFGDDTSNTFDAGDGDDYINGQGGNDQLLGQNGADQIIGGDGADVIWGHAGNDRIWGDGTNYYDTQSPGNDIIDAGDGDDSVYGGLGDDTLLGGDGNDTLIGGMTTSSGNSSGNDELNGGNGDDYLHGGDGDDRIIGGAGNDWLDGGIGRDTYVFGIGAGHDVISAVDFAYGPQDILELGAGVEPDDLRLVRTGNSLLIEIISSGDSLVITDWFSSIAYQFDEFRFANSERWNTETIAGHIWQSGDDANNTFNGSYTDENYSGLNGDDNISGNGGDDRLYGDAGNDRIDGGSGNDLLNGGLGNDVILGGDGADIISGGAGDDELIGGGGGGLSGVDVYLFNIGDGHDRITSYQNGAFNQFEELHFGVGIGSSDVSLSRQVNPVSGTDDLVFTLNATGETVSLSGFFYNPAYIGITAVRFADGVAWDYQTLLSNAFGMDVIADNLVGTDADETVGGGAGNDLLTLLGGNDVAIGGNGDDSIDGGDGYDYLYGGNGNDYVFGGAGDDTLSGDSGNDILEGGLGQDWYQFRAGDGNDVIRVVEDGASAGDVILLDRLYRSNARIYRNGNDLVIETIGSPDRVTVSGLFALSNPVNALSAVYFLDQSLSMDQIMSVLNSPTAGDDWLVGQDEEADTINALAGNDTVLGLGGADSLNGGTGDDALYGGEGNDRLYGDSTSSTSTLSGNDTLYGEGGNDFIYAGYGTDTAFGGDGDDTIYGAYTTSDTAVSGVDTLHGGAGDDKIYGNDGGDSLYGDAGIDTIVGGSGSDVIRGGDDGDFLYGDSTNTASTVAGTDTIFGDGGNDVIAGGYGNDSIDGGSGDDTLYGAYTTSDAAVSGVDTMRGGDGNDAIYGNDGNDLLFGDTGNDVIKGGSGSDQITGGTGSDTITAGTGNDTVFFGRGDGQDVVSFYDTATTRTDLLQLATGISTSDVVLSRGGVGNNDLIVQVVGTTDTVTITGYFAATANQLTGIRFTDGGVTWNRTQIQSLVDASASGQGGSSGSQVTEGSRLMTTKFLVNDLLQLTQAMASFGAESDSALMSAREQHAEPNWLTVSAVHRPESRAVL
ncbi:MAG TPA: calcium-binding protein [Permianibacter sp.]|nr:calcium-binding protein [Permianibacter sp.]